MASSTGGEFLVRLRVRTSARSTWGACTRRTSTSVRWRRGFVCPVGGMAKFSDALGVQFDYESGSIGCLRSATAVCLYREGHQHREIMVPRSSGGIDWIGSSRSIQVIDLFWNYWREFSVCYGWTESKAGTVRSGFQRYKGRII